MKSLSQFIGVQTRTRDRIRTSLKMNRMNTFAQKPEYWMKSGSKFLFHFVDILKVLSYHYINHIINSQKRKSPWFYIKCYINQGIKCYINQAKLYMNKLLCKNLDRNKTVKFGVCKCCWSGEKKSFWENSL